MRSGYDADLLAATAAVEARHFWYRARRELIVTAARSACPELATGGVIAELGCGNGSVLSALAEAFPRSSAIGLDRFHEGAAVARRAAPTVVCDAGHVPLRAAVDLVGAFDVIEHLDDDQTALQAMHDVLRRGGVALLTVPAHPRLWSQFDEASGHRRRYTPESLAAAVDRAGFEVRYLSYFMSLLYPAARIRRPRRKQADSDRTAVEDELKVGRAMNAILYRALRWERHAVQRRRRLPTGTSLLCEAVAR